MTGANDSSRRREPVARVAECERCGRWAYGVTTFESMAYGGTRPVGRPIHFCDECEEALMLSERPLEEVLMDYLRDEGPSPLTA